MKRTVELCLTLALIFAGNCFASDISTQPLVRHGMRDGQPIHYAKSAPDTDK